MVLTKHHHHRRHLHLYLHLHFPFCTWKIRAKLSCYMWKASLSSKTPQKRKSLLLCHRPMPSSSMCFCVHKKVTKGYFLFQEKYTGASTKAAYIDCVSPEHRTWFFWHDSSGLFPVSPKKVENHRARVLCLGLMNSWHVCLKQWLSMRSKFVPGDIWQSLGNFWWSQPEGVELLESSESRPWM